MITKKTTSTSSRKTTSILPQTDHPLIEPKSVAEAYSHYLPFAKKLADAEVEPMRLDVALALHNVRLGVAAVLPHVARIKAELPKVGLTELLSLPDLAGALLYASDQIVTAVASPMIQDKLRRLRTLREPMLLIAEGLAQLGLLPQERVRQIRSGTGSYDAALDGIALSALYREHELTLEGKHPFIRAQLDEIDGLGNELVHRITPTGGRAQPKDPSAAHDLRDRFAVMLVRRHAELRKVGYYLFGESVSDHVPALQSRVPRSPKPPELPAPNP